MELYKEEKTNAEEKTKCEEKPKRYCGTVYDNDTGNPMASVAVSNGRDVTLTDERGRYTLESWHKAGFVTVTIPSGYWTSKYYIPVSGRETGYDFYLDKLEADLTDHTFLQVTDSEIGAAGAGEWIEKLRRTVREIRPAFIVHTGDICYIDGLKAHIHEMNDENMGVPVRYVIGNHDYVNWGEYGEALFESIYGPVMYSFEVGRIHYIVTPIVYGDVKAKYDKSDVTAFVENDLKHVSPDKKIIMFSHNYCDSDETGFVLSDGTTRIDLKKHGLLACVFGHWHYNYLNEISGIFNITTSKPDAGGIDASPATVRSVKIRGNSLTASSCHYNDFKGAKPPLGYRWSVSLGGNILYSAPAVREGVVYAGTVDDGWPKNCAVAAVDADTGRVLWKYRTKNSVKSDIRIVGGRIVAQDTEGNVCCLDPGGKEIWTTKLRLLDPNNSSNRITADEKHIFCGGMQEAACLDARDGSIIWSKKLSGGNTSPAGFVLWKNMLFVGAQWDKLYALDTASGEVLWTNAADLLHNFIMTPAVYKGYLYTGSGNRLYKIHASTGKTVKYKEAEGYIFQSATTPYAENGILYLGTANRGVTAVDMESLEILWNFETGRNLIYTSPYVSGDIATVDSAVIPMGEHLCFGASDGGLYLIDKKGRLHQKYDVGSPVNQTPVVGEDFIITADFSGNLTRYDTM
ncbi:MAG TPA: hypothetical protein DCZ91_11250 [Lachnospiraceae bacterium]|nr:hypothetical protein [Lachnospiraceae bacterium]